MTIQLASRDLRRAVTLASRVIERRNTIPILGMVHCKANGSFAAIGTDLDTTLIAEVPRTPGGEQDFILNSPREVVAALSAAGGESVGIDVDHGKASIVSEALKLDASALSPDDFPTDLLRPLSDDFGATLSRADIAAIARVAGAVSTEETRYYLNGVVLEKIGDTTLRVAATDGHRLYFVDIEAPDAIGDMPPNAIIPRKVVHMLIELARSASDGIRIAVGRRAAANHVDSTAPAPVGLPHLSVSIPMRGASVRFTSKLIDGKYPDYRRVIPKDGAGQALFKTADLRRAATVVSGGSSKPRAAKFSFGKDCVTVSAAFIEEGLSATYVIPCQHSMGDFVIGYQGRYLTSLLEASAGEEVLFTFGSASDPALVRNPADPAWGAVIMPMRVE